MKNGQLMEILTTNGVKCEEKFKHLKEEGYASDACQNFPKKLWKR